MSSEQINGQLEQYWKGGSPGEKNVFFCAIPELPLRFPFRQFRQIVQLVSDFKIQDLKAN